LEIFKKYYGETSEFYTIYLFISLFYFIKLYGKLREKNLFSSLMENLIKYQVEKNNYKEETDNGINKKKQ
jgi:hypothetical protein